MSFQSKQGSASNGAKAEPMGHLLLGRSAFIRWLPPNQIAYQRKLIGISAGFESPVRSPCIGEAWATLMEASMKIRYLTLAIGALALGSSSDTLLAAPFHPGLDGKPHIGGLGVIEAKMGHPNMRMGHAAFGHHFRHNHRSAFFFSAPYFAYDDSNDCWWSRRYHRWVCSSY